MLRRWLLKQPGKNTTTETYFQTQTITTWQTLYITTTSWQTNTTTPWQTNTPTITLRQTQTPTSTIWQTNTDYPYSRQTQTPYTSFFQTNTSVPTYDSRVTQTSVSYSYQSTVCGNVTYQSCYTAQTTTCAPATCQTVYYNVSGGTVTGCPCVDDCQNAAYPAGYENCVHSGCGNPTGSIQYTYQTQYTTSYTAPVTAQTNTQVLVNTIYTGFPCPGAPQGCVNVIEPGGCHQALGCTNYENCYENPYDPQCSGASCTLSCDVYAQQQTTTSYQVQTSRLTPKNTTCIGEYQYVCNYTCPYSCQTCYNTNTQVCADVTYQSCYPVPVSGTYQSNTTTTWIAGYYQAQTQTSVPTTRQTTTSWTAPGQTDYTRQTSTNLGSTSWLTDYQTQTSRTTQTATSISTNWLTNTSSNTATQTSRTTTWFTV